MAMNRFESGDDCGAARKYCRWSRFARLTAEAAVSRRSCYSLGVAAQIGDVVYAGGDAGDAFVVERAPLPAVRDGVGERANFVGAQALQVLALAEKDSHVRAEEFVGGADQEVAVERGDIDQAVGAVVDGVDVGERA